MEEGGLKRGGVIEGLEGRRRIPDLGEVVEGCKCHMSLFVCIFCVRACMHASVRACVRARACGCVRMVCAHVEFECMCEHTRVRDR